MSNKPKAKNGGAAPDTFAAEPSRPVATRWIAIVLLAGLALVAAVMIALRPRVRTRVVTVIEGAAAEAFGVNRGETIDTLRDSRAVARPGRRYRVRIVDDSDDGASGIARIGGLVTFVPDARKGQVAVIEVTALRARVANAALVRVESEPGPAAAVPPVRAPAPPAAPAAPVDPAQIADGAAARADDVQPGRLFRVRLAEASRQNPETEAVVRIGGLVTIVRGARVGERAVIRIAERRSRMAFAEVVRREEN